MAHDVFICYSFEDKTIADAACVKLESAGIRCWIAPRDPVPGIPYGRQIIAAINETQVALLIFSGHANKSKHIRRELEIASEADKVIVPFRIENIVPSGDLQYYITGVHWLDAMSPPIEARFNELTALLRKLLDVPAETKPGPVVAPIASPASQPDAREARVSRRKFSTVYLAVGVIVLVALVAGLAYIASRPRAKRVVAMAAHAPKPTATHRVAAQSSRISAHRGRVMTPVSVVSSAPAPALVATPRIIYVTQKSAAPAQIARVPVTSKPTSSPAQQSAKNFAPKIITWLYKYDGKIHTFAPIGGGAWRESFTGGAFYFRYFKRMELDGNLGTVFYRTEGSYNSLSYFYLFVPDVNAHGINPDWLRWSRQAGSTSGYSNRTLELPCTILGPKLNLKDDLL